MVKTSKFWLTIITVSRLSFVFSLNKFNTYYKHVSHRGVLEQEVKVELHRHRQDVLHRECVWTCVNHSTVHQVQRYFNRWCGFTLWSQQVGWRGGVGRVSMSEFVSTILLFIKCNGILITPYPNRLVEGEGWEGWICHSIPYHKIV